MTKPCGVRGSETKKPRKQKETAVKAKPMLSSALLQKKTQHCPQKCLKKANGKH